MSTMKAARYHGNKDIRIEEVPVPEARAGECLVEVEWCGICGSDLHEYVAGPLGYPTPDRPHPLTGDHIPLTLGHEFCGRLKSVPAGSKLRVGQAVMVDPHLSCHACRSCTSGNDHLCEKLGFMGCTGGHGGGGLSQFAAVEEAHCLPLPDGLSLDYAAVIEPLAVCYHAAKVAGVPLAGLDVLIVGGGPIGIALIPILKAHGVNKILVSEPTAKRKEQAKALVDRVIDPISENVGDISRDLTGGKGVDVAFDCAGVQPGLDAAFAALKYGGLFVNIAVWEKPMTIQFYTFFLKEIKVVSSCCYNEQDFKEVMEMLAKGQLKGYEKMVTSRIALEDTVSKGFEELVNNKDEHVKILISPKFR